MNKLNIGQAKNDLCFDAKLQYNKTEILVEKGESYSLVSLNTIQKFKDWIIPAKNFDGLVNPIIVFVNPRLRDFRYFYLCGCIDKNEKNIFPIGEKKSFTVEASGELFLFMNDYLSERAYKNNKGKCNYNLIRIK